jgi:hypothetical protein
MLARLHIRCNHLKRGNSVSCDELINQVMGSALIVGRVEINTLGLIPETFPK